MSENPARRPGRPAAALVAGTGIVAAACVAALLHSLRDRPIDCRLHVEGALRAGRDYGTAPAGTPFAWSARFALVPDRSADPDARVIEHRVEPDAGNRAELSLDGRSVGSARVTSLRVENNGRGNDHLWVMTADASGSVGGEPQRGSALSASFASADGVLVDASVPLVEAPWRAAPSVGIAPVYLVNLHGDGMAGLLEARAVSGGCLPR